MKLFAVLLLVGIYAILAFEPVNAEGMAHFENINSTRINLNFNLEQLSHSFFHLIFLLFSNGGVCKVVTYSAPRCCTGKEGIQ